MKKLIAAALLAALALASCSWGAQGVEQADPPATTPAVCPSVDIVESAPPAVPMPEPTPEPTPEPEPAWIEFEATAYCACEKCCGVWAKNRPNGIVYTASGAVAQEGVTIAADWDVLPPGTVVYIDGMGERIVQDRGGGVKGNAVDIYFEDHNEALVFGRQTVRLYIVEDGNGTQEGVTS